MRDASGELLAFERLPHDVMQAAREWACGGALLLCSLLLGLMWASAARDRQVLRPEVSEKEVSAIALATAPNIGLYVGMIALALVAPRVAVFGCLVIAIIALQRTHGGRSPARTTTSA